MIHKWIQSGFRGVYPIIMCFGVLFGLCVASPALASDKLIRVGYSENPPLIFQTSKGDVCGVYADLFRAIARRNKLQVEYVSATWQENQAKLDNGQIDIIVDMPYIPEYSSRYDLTNRSVIMNWGDLYMKKSIPIQAVSDLAGRTIVGVNQDVFFEALKKRIEEARVQAYFLDTDNYNSVLRTIADGQGDVGIVPNLFGSNSTLAAGLSRTTPILTPMPMCFAVKKNSHRELLKAINSQLGELIKDQNSLYYRSMMKWLYHANQSRPGLSLWLSVFVIAGGLLLIGGLGFANFQFRSRVALLNQERIQLEKDTIRAIQEANAANQEKYIFFTRIKAKIYPIVASILNETEQLGNESADPKQMPRLAMIYKSGMQIMSITKNVTDLFKIELDQIKLINGAFRVRRLLAVLAARYQPSIDSKQLTMQIVVDDHVPEWVNGDEHRLMQVMINLMENALAFTKQGGFILRCVYKNGTLSLDLEDSGIGIPKEKQSQIFEAFTQLGSPFKGLNKGAGLGLTIASRMVALMSGRLSLQSETGGGACFKIELPLPAMTEQDAAVETTIRSWIERGRNENTEQVTLDTIRHLPTILNEIESAFLNENYRTLRVLIHQFRTTADHLRFMWLSDNLTRFAQTLDQENLDPDDIKSYMNQLMDFIRQIPAFYLNYQSVTAMLDTLSIVLWEDKTNASYSLQAWLTERLNLRVASLTSLDDVTEQLSAQFADVLLIGAGIASADVASAAASLQSQYHSLIIVDYHKKWDKTIAVPEFTIDALLSPPLQIDAFLNALLLARKDIAAV